jgi:hypothetical protein
VFVWKGVPRTRKFGKHWLIIISSSSSSGSDSGSDSSIDSGSDGSNSSSSGSSISYCSSSGRAIIINILYCNFYYLPMHLIF